jgi:predicted O-methyltransferase YrrM
MSIGDTVSSDGPRLVGLFEADDLDTAQAMLRSNLTGRARELQNEVLQILFVSPPPETAFDSVAEALLGLTPDADGFSALAQHLEEKGAALAAQAAYKGAAKLEFEAQPAMDVWGGPFNGQERRQALFGQLLEQLKIAAIVETGTYRGTTTAYMAQAGLPLFSCEMNFRYFHYSSLRLAGIPNIRLARADSRRFLRELFDENTLPPGPALFYLDAHWEHELPLWEEIDLIFSRHPAPVIMVDDFRVPADSGFAYDDYGKGKCLSVSNLREAVAVRPRMFFPNHASASETGLRRGCVVLAQGELAHAITRDVPILTELSWADALMLDGMGELRADAARQGQESERRLTEELRRIQGENEALAGMMRELAGASVRVEEALSAERAAIQELRSSMQGAEERAAAQMLELQRSVQRADERAAEQTTELQRSVQRADERAAEQMTELQRSIQRAAEQMTELQKSLQLAEARADRAAEQVAELQRSRWRHIGLRLGLARRATFEN